MTGGQDSFRCAGIAHRVYMYSGIEITQRNLFLVRNPDVINTRAWGEPFYVCLIVYRRDISPPKKCRFKLFLK